MIVRTCPTHGDRSHQNGRYCNEPVSPRYACGKELTITDTNELVRHVRPGPYGEALDQRDRLLQIAAAALERTQAR